MEEDKKILKERIKQWEPYRNVNFKEGIEKTLSRENQAIENLLKENENLKQSLIIKKIYMKKYVIRIKSLKN